MTDDNLWAPWRLSYLKDLVEQEKQGKAPQTGCFLCDAVGLPAFSPSAGDTAGDADVRSKARSLLVLMKDDRGVLMLNRYPYTNGHLMVAGAHKAQLSDFTAEERAGLMELTALGEQLLQTAVNCQGINVGINLGKAAGAGVPGHMHIHLVPRWAGDVNFMTTVGQVRVIPQALEESYDHLSDVLGKML